MESNQADYSHKPHILIVIYFMEWNIYEQQILKNPICETCLLLEYAKKNLLKTISTFKGKL